MIRSIPSDGVVAFNLTSNDTKPTQNIKTGSMVFETDTQDRYYFDEESKTWFLYTGPKLDFYTKINEDTYCYFGLSTDTKPTEIGLGSIFVEVNTSKAYIMDENGWDVAESEDAPTPQVTLQNKSVTPTTSAQSITYDSGYDGLGVVSVAAVTNAIDNHIIAENIKKDVIILGVVGTYEGEDSEPVPTPEEWAEEIAEAISLIAALPNPEEITADDREQILEAEAAVSAFLAHYTSKITNYNKLLACIEALDAADDEPEEPVDIVCTFTNNSWTAVPSDPNIYVYHTSIKSGTFVIDGVTYANTTAKIDSSAIINFHQDVPLIVRLYVAPTKEAAQTIRIDGTEIGLPTADGATVSEAGIIEINNLATGCHTITRGNGEVVIGKIELLSVNA